MTHAHVRLLLAIAAAALLAACGGSAPDLAGLPGPGAALAAPANAPVPDCEADGCTRPRIVDGLAEQYRVTAAERPAEDVAAGAPGAP